MELIEFWRGNLEKALALQDLARHLVKVLKEGNKTKIKIPFGPHSLAGKTSSTKPSMISQFPMFGQIFPDQVRSGLDKNGIRSYQIGSDQIQSNPITTKS